jgi:ABC-2 type transport system permease protein
MEMIIGDPQDVVAAFYSVILGLDSLLVVAFAVSSVNSLRGEETSGRASLAMSGQVSRTAWLGSGLAVTLLGVVVVIVAGGVGLAASAAATTYEGPWNLLWQQLVFTPAVLVVAAVAAVLLGWVPRLIALAWVFMAYGFVSLYFGGLLELPTWAMNASPISATPGVPAEPFEWGPLLIMLGIAAVLTALGFAGFRRRDLAA